ncbi:hypothetical protein CC86DRAFT_400074 [Ophiobolus disseminans]|uniref:Uncharacterized protein n=1 Tax=Ophiobolus disseminans TaxID=1469910 RepID=A0A6A7AJH9_9PLEO|nr:hypothetical protein CC86DRAFT_400074 [Ophiobolus disseminans]
MLIVGAVAGATLAAPAQDVTAVASSANPTLPPVLPVNPVPLELPRDEPTPVSGVMPQLSRDAQKTKKKKKKKKPKPTAEDDEDEDTTSGVQQLSNSIVFPTACMRECLEEFGDLGEKAQKKKGKILYKCVWNCQKDYYSI